MARVTTAEVKEILSTNLEENQLRAFITSANILVTDVLAGKHSGDILKQIELWLSAHFSSIRDQRAAEEKIGDASIRYQGRTGLGLDATLYGQQVKMLDTSGTLANLGKKKSVVEVAHEVPDA